jgi:hypothetical protein
MASTYFIDIECVNDNDSGMIIKELSILKASTNQVCSFHMLPPIHVNEKNLSLKAQSSNNYLFAFRHGFRCFRALSSSMVKCLSKERVKNGLKIFYQYRMRKQK